MSPSIAVLGTWLAMTLCVVLLGGFAGALALGRVGAVAAIRVSMWSGTTLLILALLVVNLFQPLRSANAVWLLLGLTVVAVAIAIPLWLRARRTAPPGFGVRRPFEWWVLVPIGALALVLVVVAHAAFGTVGNFDSGLYHLNALQFTADFRTIPGLGNLHDRYGTNVSVFSLAGFMENLPWGVDAFRLMVGFFVSLFAVDLSLRLLDRRSRPAPGLFVMALGALLFTPFLLSDTAYWVTSPTADTTSMLVAIVSGAFLVDALWRRDAVSGALAMMTAVLAASMRAQLWVLAVVTVVVLIFAAWHRSRGSEATRGRPRALTWVAIAISSSLFAVQLVRDALLSGWLFYPLGALPVPVEWRTGDPTVARQWIQSWAKLPGVDPSVTMGNWDWLGSWAERASDDWAVRGAAGLLALALILLWSSGRAAGTHRRGRRAVLLLMGLAVLPAVVTTAVWFVAAPDPRFAWGAIALVGLVPAALALSYVGRVGLTVPVVAGFMTLLVLPAALAGIAHAGTTISPDWQSRTYSFGPVDVVAAVNPVPVPATVDVTLDSGGVVQRPAEGDQCWTVFPLCRPTTDTTLRFLGPSLTDGIVSGS
jgi:hypothetical protein